MKKKTASSLTKAFNTILLLAILSITANAQHTLIEHNSTVGNPHLELKETPDNEFSTLKFSNENSSNSWNLRGKSVSDPTSVDEEFGLYYGTIPRWVFNENNREFRLRSKLVFIGDDREITMENNAEIETIWIQANDSQSAGRIHISKSTGDTNLKLDADWNGTGLARVVTDELELSGGSDFSEQFDINLDGKDLAEPGYIVSIDPNDSGKLKICTEAYDKKVVGIISGANGIRPGMLMGQKGSIADGEYPIALTGRVYVKATLENGEISPGDLLTTSEEAGYAMKATDSSKSFGAIIGKAMTGVDKNGFVLVLVNLQ